MDRITELVRELDNASNNDYEVLPLKHAWVGDIAKLIQETLSSGKGQLPAGLQVIADERSNRLVIKGNANKRARVRKLVDTLDSEGVRNSSTRVIFLRHADAKNIADMLNDASSVVSKDSPSNKSTSSSSSGGNSSSSSSSSRSRGGFGNGIFVRADETNNALVIIADPDTLTELEGLVRQLDVRRSQVLIEAAIVEITGTLDETLGLQWGYQGRNQAGVTNPTGSILGAAVSAPDVGSVFLRNSNFGVLVNALSKNSNVNLMSTPSVMTLDNEQSEFIAGKSQW